MKKNHPSKPGQAPFVLKLKLVMEIEELHAPECDKRKSKSVHAYIDRNFVEECEKHPWVLARLCHILEQKALCFRNGKIPPDKVIQQTCDHKPPFYVFN